MTWDGSERRKNTAPYCEQHMSFITDLVEIKTDVKNIAAAVSDGASFKRTIITSTIAVVFTFVLQVATFAFFYGKLSNQVEINTKRIIAVEEDLRQINVNAYWLQKLEREVATK